MNRRELIATQSLELADGREVIPVDALPDETDAQPPTGAFIEVIVRYQGHEWMAGRGIVEEVSIQNDVREFNAYGDLTTRYISTGRKTLTIELRDFGGDNEGGAGDRPLDAGRRV